MRFDKLTLKAQEALQEAQAITEKHEHQQVEPEHLLLALIHQTEGIIPQVFQKLGVSLSALTSQVEEALGKIAKVYGGGAGQVYSSPRLKKVMDGSFEEADRLKDAYVSTEHIAFISDFFHLHYCPLFRGMEIGDMYSLRVPDFRLDLVSFLQ